MNCQALAITNLVVNTGHVEAKVCKAQRPISVEDGLQHGGPEQDGRGKEDEGAPGVGNFTQAVGRVLLPRQLLQGRGGGLSVDVLGLPETHDSCQEDQTDQRGQNTDELGGLQDPQHDALQAGNHDTGSQSDRADLSDAPQAVLNGDHEYGHEGRENLQNPDHLVGEMSQVHVTDGGTGGHRNTNRTVRAHGSVGDQGEHGGLERVESQGYQQCHRDSNRDAETSRTLNKSGKAEGNE